MKPLLGPEGRRILRQFAWSNVLVGLDFDGTLAPIVRQPEAARMRASTATKLKKVCELYSCAVISGRARADVTPRLAEAGVKAVIGNHGLEPGASTKKIEALARKWIAALTPVVRRFPGLMLEDKRYSVAIHFRGARNKQQALAAIERTLGTLGPLRRIGGKQVLNLLPPNAPHKGDALLKLRDRLGTQTAIYVGDDVTDEDVFAMADPGRLLPVRVGKKQDSLAWYFLERQSDIDVMLDLLIAEREAYLEVYA